MVRIVRLLRIAMAAAAAAPAASRAVPASTIGRRGDRRFGGSSFLAAAAMMSPTLGAILSCTATPPRLTRTPIQALVLPILGLAHSAAAPAPRFALTVAVFVIGRA